MLYPIVNETRMQIDLSGIWSFSLVDDLGRPTFEKSNAALMNKKNIYVPASYNDQFSMQNIRSHIGWVWYEKEFTVPIKMRDDRIVLRFGSVTHESIIYLNGKEIGGNKGGFTPFEIEINSFLEEKNVLRVAVNNIVDYTTLPMGEFLEVDPDKHIYKVENNPNFDFFNYAGIHRPVKIYCTPHTFIKDIETIPNYEDEVGILNYEVRVKGDYHKSNIELISEEGITVATSTSFKDVLRFENVKLWKPLNAYLYTLRATIFDINDVIVDTYELPVGIRTVSVEGNQFLINGEPFYFKGFGMHNDSLGYGRGYNPVMDVLDLNILKKMGANSYRTSHYPYSEEMMRLSDQEGIVVIDETTAVGISLNFSAVKGSSAVKRNTFEEVDTVEAHKKVLNEMITRDKNHACVVMWSVANEPGSDEEGAYEYFEPLMKLTKDLDPQKRPATIILYMGALPDTDKVAELCDVLCLNRYYGWYVFSQDLEMAKIAFKKELLDWEKRCPNKPIMITEYGADAISGMHDQHSGMYSEEFQVAFYEANHEVMDSNLNIIGEQVWNFADFDTTPGMIRVQGNKKGILTRDRKPKKAAHYLSERWSSIPNYNYKK